MHIHYLLEQQQVKAQLEVLEMQCVNEGQSKTHSYLSVIFICNNSV